ncbi:hypothetical protein ACQY0O_006941 [Thecaphora frezii]
MPHSSQAPPSRSTQPPDAQNRSATSNAHRSEPKRKRKDRDNRIPTAAEKHAIEEESKRLRSGYRDLQAQAEDAKKNLASYGPQHLVRLLSESEKLYDRIKEPNDALLDSKFLLNMSEMGTQMMKTVKLDGGAFDVDDYVTRLARFVGGQAAPIRPQALRNGHANGGGGDHSDEDSEVEDEKDPERWDWDKLGRTAASFSRRAPTLDFLLGPLLIEQKSRKVTRRQPTEISTAPRAAPAQIRQTDLQQNKESDTSIQVRRVAKLLSEHAGAHGIGLFRFAINPESFSNTVENLFYISFLIKEGKARLWDDEDGWPTLAPASPPTEEDATSTEKHQFIWELDMAVYHVPFPSLSPFSPFYHTSSLTNTPPLFSSLFLGNPSTQPH